MVWFLGFDSFFKLSPGRRVIKKHKPSEIGGGAGGSPPRKHLPLISKNKKEGMGGGIVTQKIRGEGGFDSPPLCLSKIGGVVGGNPLPTFVKEDKMGGGWVSLSKIGGGSQPFLAS